MTNVRWSLVIRRYRFPEAPIGEFQVRATETTGLAGNIGNFKTVLRALIWTIELLSMEKISAIVSAAPGFNPNGGLASVPLIKDSVVFVLHGVSGLSISDISHVGFQYGTALTELNVHGDPGNPPASLIPEPGNLALIGLGFAGLGVMRRRQK